MQGIMGNTKISNVGILVWRLQHWAKRRIILSWKMSQQLISLKFPPFLNTNTTREHVSREKLILSVFAHVLWVHHAAIYKRIEQEKRECFWDSLQMLMTDDSFVFIHEHDLAQACRNCEDWKILLIRPNELNRPGSETRREFGADLLSGHKVCCDIFWHVTAVITVFMFKVPFKEKNLMIILFSCCWTSRWSFPCQLIKVGLSELPVFH